MMGAKGERRDTAVTRLTFPGGEDGNGESETGRGREGQPEQTASDLDRA